jgi:hypothetical protein
MLECPYCTNDNVKSLEEVLSFRKIIDIRDGKIPKEAKLFECAVCSKQFYYFNNQCLKIERS